MDLRIPVSSNRWFAYRVRMANVKMPRLLVFTWRVGVAIIETQKPRRMTLMEAGHCSSQQVLWIWRRTHLAMPKNICAPDSSSLKPGSGATKGVLDKGVSGQPDYVLWPDCWTMKIQD